MKFCTFQKPDGSSQAGWLYNDAWVVDMNAVSQGQLPRTMSAFLDTADKNLQLARQIDGELTVQLSLTNLTNRASHVDLPKGIYDLDGVRLLPPLPKPASIRDFYAFEEHVKTARRHRGLDMVPQWYDFPVFYFTNHQAVAGPEDEIAVPPGCTWFDYELEMACVIGRHGKDIPSGAAHDFIFGYTIMNDWSARDLQREEMKVGLGPAKGKDFATSLGPWIVTPDELAPYQDGQRYNLAMTASVNGKLLSEGNYRDIYFTFEQMIERASAGVSLYPGDVIGSGTVGTGCILELGTDIHRWLIPGDLVELSITGLGTLRNVVKGC